MKLSDKIRIIRKARGLSQEALGDSLSRTSKDGISRQSVSDWENGKSEPKLNNIRDLAEVLDVSYDALLDENIDLNDQKVLSSVLKNLSPEIKQVINCKFRYSLYVNTLSVKSFLTIIIGLTIFLITVLFGSIAIVCNWGESWIFIFGIGGGMFIGILPIMIKDSVRIFKNKECVCVGELNNTHLILNSINKASNTIYIPIDKIEKIELSNGQRKHYGNISITIIGRSKPIIINKLMNPKRLIEIYKDIINKDEEDAIGIV